MPSSESALNEMAKVVARGVQWERQHLGLGKRQLALTHFSLPQVQGPQTVSAVGRPVEIAVVTERREHLVACRVDRRPEVLGNGACKGTLLRLDVPQVLAAESAWEVRRENEELVVWRQRRVPHLRAVVFIAVHQAKGHRGAEAVALLLGEVDVARQVGPVHLHAAGEEQRLSRRCRSTRFLRCARCTRCCPTAQARSSGPFLSCSLRNKSMKAWPVMGSSSVPVDDSRDDAKIISSWSLP